MIWLLHLTLKLLQIMMQTVFFHYHHIIWHMMQLIMTMLMLCILMGVEFISGEQSMTYKFMKSL